VAEPLARLRQREAERAHTLGRRRDLGRRRVRHARSLPCGGYARQIAKIDKNDQEWRAELTPAQYHVLREKGTEAPFSGEYDHVFEPGTYRCVGCGAELFDSDAKYDSGCGWPAFHSPTSRKAVEEETDTSYGMVRTEVLCASCGGHLGHVFPDGPHPTGLRYCINSAALELDER